MADTAERDLLLDEQLCFALHAAARAVTDVYRPLLGELGLTYPQYLVLLVLWERDARSVGELVDELALDYGTVSPLLARLADRGLVTRERTAGDGRTVLITLTDGGHELRDHVGHVPVAIACAMGLDAGQRRSLIRTLRTLATTRQAPIENPHRPRR